MIDLSDNELKVSRETSDQVFKRQEEIMKQVKEYLDEKIKLVLIRTHSK